MSLTDPFDLLGLDRATAAEADVKAAYARLLKTTRPEDDRDAFMALRNAFSAARSVAKQCDFDRAHTPEPAQDVAPTPPIAKPIEVKWTYFENLDWNCTDDAFGNLVKATLDWIVAGGPDATKFVQHVAETLIATPEIDTHRFRVEVQDFLSFHADPDRRADELNDWDAFDPTRPVWLNDNLMRALHSDLQILKEKPTVAWQARNYNALLILFAPVLEADTVSSPDAMAPIDTSALFADEQDTFRKDDHGSFFDRDKMVWTDMSPVGIAMRDIQGAIDRGLWDVADTVKEILQRDELQPLDEFQDLDNRLRDLICNETGWPSEQRQVGYPTWFSAKMAVLLDNTFGWSHHYGRHHWERQQLDWLHKVLSRDVKRAPTGPSFKQAVGTYAPHQTVPEKPLPLAMLLARLYRRPHEILLGYFGYRLLQVIVRLAS